MALPLIPLAVALAQFAPKIIGWLAGEKAEETAEKVVGIATEITGFKDPQQAAEAIKASIDLQLKFQTLANELALGLEREYTAQLAIINQTMQQESKSEHWPQWGWRPFWGFISALAFLVVCIFVCQLGKEAIAAKDANAIGMIPVVVGAFTTLFAVPGAILGITAWGRNKLKEGVAGTKGEP